MKFFDYKFIILLALTLIIYFIYREVDSLNERLTKLENNMKKEETGQISHEVPIEAPVLNHTINPEIKFAESLPVYNSNIILSKDSFAPKNISIDLLPTNNNTLYSVVSSDSESDSESEYEDETTYSTSHTSKHLAIYSNDNEQTEDTHHSLLESIKLNNKQESFDFNYNIKENNTVELSENIELNCTSESSEHVELTIVNNNTIESESESSEINLESESSEVKLESESLKLKLESESSEVKLESESLKLKLESESSEVKLESESSEVKLESESSEVKLESESSEVKLEVEQVKKGSQSPEISESVKKIIEASESSSSDINIVVKTSSSDTKRKYDRMKLQELQNVAQTMEINLVKKIKGIDKQKTKNELIKEILKKNI